VAPGIGGLVRLGGPGQASGSSYFLVTDAGVKYRSPTPRWPRSWVTLVGAATVLPSLLALLPTGPVLDPDEAGR
jgi:hypothetical protein